MTASENGHATDVRQNTMICSVEFHLLGNSKKVPSSAVTTDADPAALRISKQLIDSPELRELGHLRSEIRGYLADMAFPSMLKSGLWLIPVRLLECVEDRLQGYTLLWRGRVDEVIGAYPERCQESQARLASLYDVDDYLTTDTEGWEQAIRDQCGLASQWLEWSVPARLQGISMQLWERERVKAEEQWAAITASARQILREQFAAFVAGLSERLTGDDKKLQQRYLDRLTVWTQAFRDGRDLTDDVALQALVTQADDLLRGHAAKDLRSDGALQAYVTRECATMRETLAGMLGKKPARQYAVLAEPKEA